MYINSKQWKNWHKIGHKYKNNQKIQDLNNLTIKKRVK